MTTDLEGIMCRLEARISENSLLYSIFQDCDNGIPDMGKYKGLGYNEEDIVMGNALISIYTILKEQCKGD